MTVSVAILADDLIWSDRLVRAVRSTEATPAPVATLARFELGLATADAAIVDLTARAYDGLAAVTAAHAAGRPVLAVGQHDDRELRAAALAAGADRVFAYRKLFEDGPRTIATWLAAVTGATARTVPAR